jgi:hypothetical protein
MVVGQRKQQTQQLECNARAAVRQKRVAACMLRKYCPWDRVAPRMASPARDTRAPRPRRVPGARSSAAPRRQWVKQRVVRALIAEHHQGDALGALVLCGGADAHDERGRGRRRRPRREGPPSRGGAWPVWSHFRDQPKSLMS